jgi:hypothetical protein
LRTTHEAEGNLEPNEPVTSDLEMLSIGRRERDIYEHAVHAVIAQAASEIARAGRERESRPDRDEVMRGIWIALSLPIWGLVILFIRWLLS